MAHLRNVWLHITGDEKRTLVRKLRDALPPDGIVAFRTAQFDCGLHTKDPTSFRDVGQGYA